MPPAAPGPREVWEWRWHKAGRLGADWRRCKPQWSSVGVGGSRNAVGSDKVAAVLAGRQPEEPPGQEGQAELVDRWLSWVIFR